MADTQKTFPHQEAIEQWAEEMSHCIVTSRLSVKEAEKYIKGFLEEERQRSSVWKGHDPSAVRGYVYSNEDEELQLHVGKSARSDDVVEIVPLPMPRWVGEYLTSLDKEAQ